MTTERPPAAATGDDRRQRVEAIARAAGRISHDLNNQLTVLLGVLDLALLDGDERARRPLHEARRAAERIAKLVYSLQRLDADRRVSPRPVDLVSVVRGVADRTRGWVGERVQVSVHADADTLPIVTDPELVEQALVNVVVNATRAVGERGTIDITIGHDDNGWRIAVRDDGHGIDPDILDVAFEPLTTTRDLPGAGMGLSHALLALAALDGDITLAARDSGGAEAVLSGPLNRATGPVSERPPAVLVQGSGRVLVVDDSPVLLMAAHAILSGAGYDVTLARGHGRALDHLTSGLRPDLVLAEAILYDGGAAELLDWLRRRDQRTPVIATVFVGEQAPADADLFAAVVTKPFDAHSLSATAAEALAG